ncbi:MAG: hypothetical protein KF826_02615 [Xanthobacteraceae bacterium]|nr:hypothetical protein [Xanthobacteraceae bacterium]MBX3523851.1 hypothetical protein [Xanthobacteraceae bacterium]MBX3533220.1 hypothetical protein [Xanthobacteraceae bacterium]MBX3547647.1 hypothetical protein [Xanthobacteraceae bacterium]MCW5674883.1 hypothetical protein [Xanthobacteraceae bacterium]
MKLEYRDLSSSSPARPKRSGISSFGFLDFFAGSLLLFVASAYFVMPRQIDRAVDWVVYESSANTFASLRCIRDRTTKYLFTQTRDVLELKNSVRLVRQAELDRFGKPQPDAACYAVGGFVEKVPRWDYFFGWLTRAVS